MLESGLNDDTDRDESDCAEVAAEQEESRRITEYLSSVGGAAAIAEDIAQRAHTLLESSPHLQEFPEESHREAILEMALSDERPSTSPLNDSSGARSVLRGDAVKLLGSWSARVHECHKVVSFIARPACQEVRAGFVALVEQEHVVPGCEENETPVTATSYRWLHCDEIKGAKAEETCVGRFVNLDNYGRVLYTGPGPGCVNRVCLTESVKAGRTTFRVPNTTVKMVKATGPFCSQMAPEVLSFLDMLPCQPEPDEQPCWVCGLKATVDEKGERAKVEYCKLCKYPAHDKCVLWLQGHEAFEHKEKALADACASQDLSAEQKTQTVADMRRCLRGSNEVQCAIDMGKACGLCDLFIRS